MTIPTFPAIATQLTYLQLQIWNGLLPEGGLQAMLATADFSTGSAFTIDLTIGNLQQKLTNIQSVFIDNSQNAQGVTLASQTPGGTTISIPGGYQAYLPLLQPNPPKFIVSSTGTGKTNFYFVNAPLPAAVWPSAGAVFKFDANGNLLVSDAALDAIISGGVLASALKPVDASPFSQAVISFAAAGDNIVIPNVAAQVTRVYGLELVVAGATNLTFKDSTPTSFSGALPFGANGSEIKDRGNYPWYVCGTAKDFIINSSAAVQVSGTVWYTQH